MIGENKYMRKKYNKFQIKKSSAWLICIILILSSVSYIACSYYLNLENIASVNDLNLEKVAKLQTLKDILLVIISICGANFLLGVVVEVKSKNNFLTDIIVNDVISCPEFYELMDDKNKNNIYNALEKQLYFEYGTTHDMFKSIREKLNNTIDDYYFDSCEYIVSCNISGNYIEKEITKKVSIKSYSNTYTIKDFSVGNFTSKLIEGVESYKLINFEINGDSINLEKNITEQSNKMSNLDEQNEYNSNKTYIYNKPLKINNKTPTIILVKAKTRTTIDDKASTFRVTKPCKNFSLIYSIKQHEKYRLAVDAFGFLDDADDSVNNTSAANINIKFKDWIFKYDGVVVIILDK